MKTKLIYTSLSLLSFSAFSSTDHTSLVLEGSYTSECNFTDSIYNDGYATKSTFTFKNNTVTFEEFSFSDALCLNEVIEKRSTPITYRISDNEYVGVINAGIFSGPYYKFITYIDDDFNYENREETVFFTLVNSTLTGTKEILYMGVVDSETNKSSYIDFEKAWIK